MKLNKYLIEAKKIKLDRRKAKGLSVFKYWHTCPICGYSYITEDAKLCPVCGAKIEFFGEVNYK